MNVTRQEFFDAFTPLLLALHQSKALDIAELPHYYEDVLVRRQHRGDSAEALAFLKELIQGLHRLALVEKAPGRDTPPT